MKKIIYSLFGIAIVIIFASANTDVQSPCDSPVVGDHSGAPGETDCSGCHSSPVNPNIPDLKFEVENNISNYVPGKKYLVNISIKRKGHNKFGFVCTSLDSLNKTQGTFDLINTITTRKFSGGGGRKYISHTPCGADSQDRITWKYNWTAPATNQGKIKIYMALLVANHNHALTGDTTYTRVLTLTPNLSGGINNQTDFEKAKVFPTVFTNELNIEFDKQSERLIKQITLLNMAGKTIEQLSTSESRCTLNTESYCNGMYFIKINYNNISQFVKLIKQ